MALGVVLSCIAVLLVAGVAAVAGARRSITTLVVYALATTVSGVALIAATWVLITEPGVIARMELPLGLPWVGAHFRLDCLSALFLVVVNLGGFTTGLYGLGYGPHESNPGRVLPFYLVFLAGMNLVVLADDAFTFLLTWEFMSLSSWALVMTHHRDKANTTAGHIYLLMASFGTLALLLVFGLLAGPAGGYGFDAVRAASPSAGLSAAVLVLALLGAGAKAARVPLHVWLPRAHPAAPSHVSA